ncbi:MAG TPA: SDR family oxidoreductase [Arenicellales bacterium]|jgi:NAD(P)-dependent dehydrogenase (short-subunit alcohol dehydrogenase family)|nr:SDR family oxidoreductase [Arenicellales bacterium]|tara:strand:+ start:3518 stop:4246 length:729 start_codon:yes stop_codon:yes gene_type:complete
MNLSGQKALVTGAAGGIGKAIVKALQSAGAVVAGADQVDSDACEFSFLGDLTDPGFCDNLPESAATQLDGLDIVINNAGVIRRGPITQASDDDYAVSFAVNVEAPFRICRAAIPLLAENGGGAIVNIASCWGVRPGPNHPLYCMSKAAIASMTQCLGHDHAHQGVRINAVCPNEVDTPMLRSGFEARGLDPQHAIDELNKSVPIGHIARPDEIADIVIFLASDQSRYMCGALVEVNGGKPVV